MGLEDYTLVALFGRWSSARSGREHHVEAAGRRRDHRQVVTEVLKQRLASYGKPEFTTDASKYTPVAKAQPVAAG